MEMELGDEEGLLTDKLLDQAFLTHMSARQNSIS